MYAITTATKKIAALNKRIRAIPGGTSAGKTIGVLEVLIGLAQADTTHVLTSVVSESFPHLRRGAMRDFLDILETQQYFKPERWSKTDFTYTFETGSKIEFFSADQPGKVRGPRRHRLFINEANNVPYETFDQLEVRTSDFIFLDWNPTNEFWYYTDVKNRDDVQELTLTYQDNEALDPSIVRSIEQRKNRPSWWQVYGLGQLGEVEGRIYTGWPIIEDVPHEARLERYGVDFGWHPDPAAIVAVYYYNGGYILDEVACQLEMSNREMAETLKNLPRALTIADSAEPKSIAELRLYGLNVTPTLKGPDSVRHGIKAVQDQRISVTKRSTTLIKEYRNYLWATDKEGHVLPGVPEDGNDHCLDAARYAVNSLVPVIRRKELYPSTRRNITPRANIAV